jgi:rhodanese-related sulfurtransferase
MTTPSWSAADVRQRLQQRGEVALVDLREEDPHAQAHPLFAAQLSLGRLELDAPWRLPRRDVPLVLFDDGEGLVAPAAQRLHALGYTQVRALEGGLAGWRASGGELFRDVNVPSKAFGELVEHERGTPSLPAEEVKALLDRGANVVLLDMRRYDEYQTMSLPGSISVPGAELLLRLRDLAPDPATQVIVHCAGRTRSLIGTQALVNAGVPNPVAALRNGTIGWTLAGHALALGQQARCGPASPRSLQAACKSAQRLADATGAQRLDAAALADWAGDTTRTLYRWDVRTPEEYAAGHRPGFGSAPGGQLVQETDVYAAVRGARIALADDDGVRAPITAHWLAQMGWEVGWLDGTCAMDLSERGPWQPGSTPAPQVPLVEAAALHSELAQGGSLLLDFSPGARYLQAHVAGAAWSLRSQLDAVVAQLPAQARIVTTCGDGRLARWAASDLQRLLGTPVRALAGGNAAWAAAGLALTADGARLLSPRIDRYQRPYEGTQAPREAMQAYLDWEFGLVAQLHRDGSHGFRVWR